MPTPQTVFVLQGGGALGAYQGGACQGLLEGGIRADWIVGTSIGAINGAILAGNPPERRMEKLRAFWQRVTRDAPATFPFFGTLDWFRPWREAAGKWETLTQGVPGFFAPRGGDIWNINQPVAPDQTGFYDTSPLEATLNDLVDFKYLNARHVRLTVSAVDVATGELTKFDNTTHTLTARHIMASGALPPGFPPVAVDGRIYWDGGIYSNTPIDIVLDDVERRNTLCFMIDLWDPTEEVPASIAQVLARQKDIQYASRSTEHLDDHTRAQNLRRAIQILSARLPEKERKLPEVKKLMAMGCESTINIVRLIMKALPEDDQSKDIDFSSTALTTRWQAGLVDAGRVLAQRGWLKQPPAHIGMVVHELSQE